MPANNIHILSPEEIVFIRNRFVFEVKDDSVLVRVNGFNRTTAHKLTGFTQSFAYNGKKRKMTISQLAISYWMGYFRLYSLIEVQNCINMLLITYQDVTVDNIKSLIANPNNIKVQNI